MLTIVLLVAPDSDSHYIIYRVLATFIGLLISISVNRLIKLERVHSIKNFG
ncbi:hypothetical protein [Vagococcus penaei]|uniref:hypothetical protein n=1 Tax=Vagococcus penaei TaxID=633807 RepID=UPI0014737872|nr:hypothetical protein [Vagococcus penaei]